MKLEALREDIRKTPLFYFAVIPANIVLCVICVWEFGWGVIAVFFVLYLILFAAGALGAE